jgi:hypothetical protein
MNNLVLIYLVSTVVGIVGAYYLIKMAVKNGIEAANKPKVEKDGKKEYEVPDVVIIGGVFLLLLTIFMVGYKNGMI